MSQNSRSRRLSKPEYISKLETKAKRQKTRLQKQGVGEGITDFAVKKTMQILKIPESEAEIFSVAGKHKQSEWDAYGENLEKYLTSPHATKKGREKIRKKIISTLRSGKEIGGAEGGETWNLSYKEANRLVSIFEDDIYSKMQDKYGLTSGETIDLSRDFNLSSDDVLSEMSNMLADDEITRDNFYSELQSRLSAKMQ